MPKSYSNLISHIVFSTKDRKPLITPDLRPDLFAYLGGIVHGIQGHPITLNGMADHVHLLVSLPPDVAVADAVRIVKVNSSKWARERVPRFAWQAGYGAFSVSRSNVPAVFRYIKNQGEHHKNMDYREEFLKLLRAHGVEFDERYLWS